MMFPTSLLIEFFCLLFAVIYLRKDRESYWYRIIWFMLFITLTDGAGWAIAVFDNASNHWLYNIELPVEVFFTSWLFYKVYQPLFNIKPWIIAGLIVFSISYIIETSRNHFFLYNDISASIASVLFIIASGFYYYLLLKKEEPIIITKDPLFWLVSGMFLFYFSSMAIDIFFNELMQITISKHISVRYLSLTLLNTILYGCWIYAFRCRYRQTILSAS